ncbi:MSMEG_0567/Sll0786 family nitrogen starvation N-acetyltransferase [Pseudomonas veronii]|uniref:MSMEG_0567/Sll0786 family nitrogen starvation N-acetyltransferase n=1 Tax=Pseudomonas TaxID=286 RepID=UPI00061DB2A2|nr:MULTISPECIES: MSMEG_0567/Sll0786 family nitrogen starvation N-acetyltransferase [Pseudomonas]NWC56093.1 GNAT family N-acetyltransferase [Pseudomonas veronii]NWD59391.1 GNAT family N-acetyltransferase [Pseudomonas veronii]PUB37429.1 putative N-acetyltransferase (TIGR04045 family) [Pseudomonas sp. GV105]QPO20675.1 GNAT family N-acetyltransferase [Pseudomonas sp. Y39-6]RTY66570.1 GNAT family N-acetyltransferase [Pseudomonas veronii]
MPTQTFALIDDTFADFLADDLLVKPALATWERQDYYTLRRAVFSDEQQLLAQDRDEKDFQAIPIVAVAHHCGMPERVVGAVRIYETEPGVWYGGRLCVERAYRRHGMIGKALINEAVSRAIDLGCHTFLATVQQANEGYFLGLHWQTLQAIDVFGHAHCLMQAQLDCYPFMPRNVALPPRKVVRHG